jgi:hypothetical protein
MRWKSGLTPLDQVSGLDDSVKQKLVTHHITTAEELVGQIESSANEFRQAFGLSPPEVEELHERALEAAGPEFGEALKEQRGFHVPPLGALPPDEDN